MSDKVIGLIIFIGVVLLIFLGIIALLMILDHDFLPRGDKKKREAIIRWIVLSDVNFRLIKDDDWRTRDKISYLYRLLKKIKFPKKINGTITTDLIESKFMILLDEMNQYYSLHGYFDKIADSLEELKRLLS